LLVDRAGGNSGMMYNGSCVDFDGTDAYVTYGDVDWLDGLTAISVCCWLYQDGAPPNSGGVFLSKDNAIECWTKQDTENKYIMSINNNHRSLEGGGTPALGAWVHVVMTWNSTGDVRKLYLNGAYADVDTGGNQSGNSINNTADGLAIGARANGSYEIDGKIADTKVFSKELSASQVKEMYEDSKVIIPSNMPQTALTLWAPLTDGAGTIAYDGSGYGRDGTYTGTGFLSGQTGCPQLVEGYNRPFLFDADGYAYTSLTMNALTDYTFSWWSRSTSPGGNTGLFSSGGSSVGAFHQNWSNNRPLLYLAGNNYRYWVDTPAQDDGQWHHWLITYVGTASGNNQAANSSLYVDGVLISPWSATNSATPTAWGTFSIGRLTGAGTWSGNLNEFIIYNGELSSSERAALYAIDANGGPLPPDPMSLSNSSDVLAYWRNDGNVTWADRSGNGYTGTVGGSPDALLFKQGINGSASTSTGRDGQGFPLKFENNGAIGFTGMLADEGTRITGVDPTAFSYITVSAWVKIVGNTNWGTIAMQADDNSFNAGWGLGFSGTSSTFMWWVDHYNDPATADISSHYGKWLHVVGTYNGTDQKLYFNGVEVDSEADTWTNKGAATNEIHVGTGIGTSNPVFRYGLDGQIGNIQIYNRALRVAEITQNFNAQKSRFT
jgi:hypothetical protein